MSQGSESTNHETRPPLQPQREVRPMDCVDPDLDLRVIDPRFFAEWVAFGMLELTIYLTRYAEFEAYCERRDSPIA